MSNSITNTLNANAKGTLVSPTLSPQRDWFSYASQQLDQFDAQQAIKREAREQVTKRFTLKDTDPVTGIVRVYRMSLELTSTENSIVSIEVDDDEGGAYAS